VLNRNRGGAYISFFVASLCLFATLFFLTFYLQRTLNYSPIKTGLAFLPISVCLAIAANLSTIVLMPRLGPRPVVTTGLLVAAGAMAWLARLGPHTSFSAGVLGPIIVAGFGLGMVVAPAINTGTYGVAPQDAGVASATVNVGQQLGASIGTSLLNTIFATAVALYVAAHGSPAIGQALAHGYDTAFWWASAIAAGGALLTGLLFRSGPLSNSQISAG
jgi:MFS family permease